MTQTLDGVHPDQDVNVFQERVEAGCILRADELRRAR
jgi:hypothetical protein